MQFKRNSGDDCSKAVRVHVTLIPGTRIKVSSSVFLTFTGIPPIQPHKLQSDNAESQLISFGFSHNPRG